MIKRIVTVIALSAFILPSIAVANCGWWQTKLNSAERKLSREGNQSQVKQWQKERNYYANELEKCNKSNGTHRWIETTNGTRRATTDYIYEQPRPVNTDNLQAQQIIQTCNFWIEQYNQNPDADNSAMKNSACRNADNMANTSTSAKPQENFKPTRSLKECVKPNNAVDNDVKLCMQGLKDPKWATTKK